MVNNSLIKIKDVSDKYGITARTLRYYEDMGLIESIRSEDYAYRSYTEETIKKLEQILILRRLSISVRDIKRIFDTSGTEIVLEVLGNKVKDIDNEVALLYELKEIVLKFIRQINQADFTKDSDVKMLYEQAKEIENQIINSDNAKEENAVDLNRLIEVSDELIKSAEMRFDMVSTAALAAINAENSQQLAHGVNQISIAVNQMEKIMQSNPTTSDDLKNRVAAFAEISMTCSQTAMLAAELNAAIQELANGVKHIHLAAEKYIQSVADGGNISNQS